MNRLILVGAALLLVSCQKPPTVLIGTDLPELLPAVKAALANQPQTRDWVVSLEGTAVIEGPVARLTTSAVGAPSLPPLRPVRSALWQEVSMPRPLVQAAPTGTVPLLFDVWGRTVLGPSRSVPLDWETLTKGPRFGLLVAGSRPAFRQMAYAFSGEDLKALAQVVASKAWQPDVWHFSEADQRSLSKSGAIVVETYRDYERGPGAGERQFGPLLQGGESLALVGPVVILEFRGSADEVARLEPLVPILTGTAFQKDAGKAAQWLGANTRTPDIDGEGAALRTLVQRVARFIPVTDRIAPEGDSIQARVQRTVDQIPR